MIDINIPFTLEKILAHPRTLLMLTYYQFNMCDISITNYGDGEKPTCFLYPQKDLDDVAVRRALTQWTGLSDDTVRRHYDELKQKEVIKDETFSLLSKEQFETIYSSIAADFPDYQCRNQIFRVVMYMYVKCCLFTPYTASLTDMSKELCIHRNILSCGIRYAAYHRWIGYVHKAYFNASEQIRKAASYQFHITMVPKELRLNKWYKQHILYRVPSSEEDENNLRLCAKYARRSLLPLFSEEYVIERFRQKD